MSDSKADFAVVGTTPLAQLVAGLLAARHGKSVVLIGETASRHRLPQGVDLSIAPLTRPDTWSLLRSVMPETLKLVSRIGGRGAWSRVDPILLAEGAQGKQALAHVRHMAMAFGWPVETLLPNIVGSDREGFVSRHAALLHRPTLDAGLERWLRKHKVRRFPAHQTLVIAPDGSAQLTDGDARIAIGQTILADDAALISHLTARQWPSLLQRQDSSAVLTLPTSAMAGRLLLQLDHGLMLSQQDSGGILAIGPGNVDQLSAGLMALLGQDRAARHAGQVSWPSINTADGAPAVGRLNGPGPDVLAGFGPTGLFLAPAIARWLSGVSTESESQWFAARLINRSLRNSPVAEWGGMA